MPEMEGEYVHLPRPENADIPGAPPHRYCAPLAIVQYCLDWGFR